MEEAPTALSTIVGGRGHQLDTARGGAQHSFVEDAVTVTNGRSVRGSNEATDKKVSDITF